MNRILTAALGLTLAAASLADAQVRVRERAPMVVARQQAQRGWLGFSYDTSTRRVNGQTVTTIVIQQVHDGSPAMAAGLQVGDTVTTVNDIRVSEQFMSSLGYSLAPGDEVRVGIRRAGRERTITLTAAERPAEFALPPEAGDFVFELNSDSIRDRMRIYIDSMRVTLDSLKLPRMRIERTPGGVWMYTDTGRVRIVRPDSGWVGAFEVLPRDSLHTFFEYRFPRDSMRFMFDSAFARVLPDMRSLQIHVDSMHTRMDSVRWLMPDRNQVWVGSPEGITIIGSRAIAGAELTELNPGLGEYFGTDQGVLVVRVPDGTPAARAGLQAGDVIVNVNGNAIDDISSLRRRISQVRAGESIGLGILRKKQARTIELKKE